MIEILKIFVVVFIYGLIMMGFGILVYKDIRKK